MKILIATTAIPGHLNPLLGLARILVKHGHEVLVQTGNTFKPMVEAAGISFIPLLPEADAEVGQFFAKHPEIHEKKPFEWFGFAIENFFLPRLPARARHPQRLCDRDGLAAARRRLTKRLRLPASGQGGQKKQGNSQEPPHNCRHTIG